ncbi:DJ-1/PfpI family protein [Actinoallomurus rhizosphaericola]|uniref:DJ-1/PfpI family protein n=1 Tax=Actinoallomurus rhizosphaericola TaxID=2952536 RepID=UPI0020932AC0|nr:DJ-1/PfpI family protein [Actinoallomurus rhizosphaericola]MCO5996935.1 DJ-1/PfpI family protein [Actinoallomurus rhizosphaericola]
MLAQFVLFDGFDPLDVIAPFEVFSAAGMFTDRVNAELVAAEGPREVQSGIPAISLTAAASLDPDRADLIVVPGAAGRSLPAGQGDPTGEDAEDTIPAVLGRTLTTGLPALLGKAMAAPDTTVATVCGGSLILSMAGLIGGRKAITHHQGLDVLGASGVDVIRARVVDDGDLVTSGGVTSGLDLGLYLLEREVGPKVALAVERLFEHERRGVVWRDLGPVPMSA